MEPFKTFIELIPGLLDWPLTSCLQLLKKTSKTMKKQNEERNGERDCRLRLGFVVQ